MLQTDAEKNYKTDEKSLLQEFVVTIREYFDISVVQQEGKAVISLADGDMTVYRTGGDADELSEFINMMSPRSIFTSLDTFEAVGIVPVKTVNVMCRLSDIQEETAGDSLSSKELYGILSAGGFDMPDYSFFAVDFCRRLNRGYADYFAVKGKF